MEPSRLLFTHHLWASATESSGRFYRPLLTLWFLINKSIFGLNPPRFPRHHCFGTCGSRGTGVLHCARIVGGSRRGTFCDCHLCLPSPARGIGVVDFLGERLPRSPRIVSPAFCSIAKPGTSRIPPARWWAAGGSSLPSRTPDQRSKHSVARNYPDDFGPGTPIHDPHLSPKPYLAAISTYGLVANSSLTLQILGTWQLSLSVLVLFFLCHRARTC